MSVIGVFCGPWDSGHVAKDGALIGFADIERCTRRALEHETCGRHQVVWLDVSLFLSDDAAERLSGLDVVYGNCGPTTALLFFLRERHRLAFRIVREARTLGWIGYSFQEFIARTLARPDDVCAHVCPYSGRVWNRLRKAGRDLHHYPLLDRVTPLPAKLLGAPLRCGYFSRLARHKGFHFVPAIVAKLRAANWPIESLVTCGAIDDQALFADCREALRQEGVSLQHNGQASHAEALDLMEQVDIVLFPSVSNIEAVGRTVVEALARGKTVIASDYAGAADLLGEPYRIPLFSSKPRSGPSAEGFCIADLALSRWQPPAPGEPPPYSEGCRAYLHDRSALLSSLGLQSPHGRLIGSSAKRNRDVRLSFDWAAFEHWPVERWCEAALAHLRAETRSRADLLDLGGAMKRAMRAAGFEPDATFSLAEHQSANESEAARKRMAPAEPVTGP